MVGQPTVGNGMRQVSAVTVSVPKVVAAVEAVVTGALGGILFNFSR